MPKECVIISSLAQLRFNICVDQIMQPGNLIRICYLFMICFTLKHTIWDKAARSRLHLDCDRTNFLSGNLLDQDPIYHLIGMLGYRSGCIHQHDRTQRSNLCRCDKKEQSKSYNHCKRLNQDEDTKFYLPHVYFLLATNIDLIAWVKYCHNRIVTIRLDNAVDAISQAMCSSSTHTALSCCQRKCLTKQVECV